MSNQKKILLGLTTTPGSDWRNKIQEIDSLGLKELVGFPTFLGRSQRKEFYALLEKTCLEKMPHVHLRDDMERGEIEYFIRRWKTEVFNIHPYPNFKKFLLNQSFRKITFVENHNRLNKDFFEVLALCGGICLDFAHWKVRENNRWKGYENFGKCLKENKIGCCHISAVRKKWGFFWTDDHHFESLADFDYLLPWRGYLPSIISLELENSLAEQLKVKAYLENKIINSSEESF